MSGYSTPKKNYNKVSRRELSSTIVFRVLKQRSLVYGEQEKKTNISRQPSQ